MPSCWAKCVRSRCGTRKDSFGGALKSYTGSINSTQPDDEVSSLVASRLETVSRFGADIDGEAGNPDFFVKFVHRLQKSKTTTRRTERTLEVKDTTAFIFKAACLALFLSPLIFVGIFAIIASMVPAQLEATSRDSLELAVLKVSSSWVVCQVRWSADPNATRGHDEDSASQKSGGGGGSSTGGGGHAIAVVMGGSGKASQTWRVPMERSTEGPLGTVGNQFWQTEPLQIPGLQPCTLYSVYILYLHLRSRTTMVATQHADGQCCMSPQSGLDFLWRKGLDAPPSEEVRVQYHRKMRSRKLLNQALSSGAGDYAAGRAPRRRASAGATGVADLEILWGSGVGRVGVPAQQGACSDLPDCASCAAAGCAWCSLTEGKADEAQGKDPSQAGEPGDSPEEKAANDTTEGSFSATMWSPTQGHCFSSSSAALRPAALKDRTAGCIPTTTALECAAKTCELSGYRSRAGATTVPPCVCNKLTSCDQCSRSGCIWCNSRGGQQGGLSPCVSSSDSCPAISSVTTAERCPNAAGLRASCQDCTLHGSMWCNRADEVAPQSKAFNSDTGLAGGGRCSDSYGSCPPERRVFRSPDCGAVPITHSATAAGGGGGNFVPFELAPYAANVRALHSDSLNSLMPWPDPRLCFSSRRAVVVPTARLSPCALYGVELYDARLDHGRVQSRASKILVAPQVSSSECCLEVVMLSRKAESSWEEDNAAQSGGVAAPLCEDECFAINQRENSCRECMGNEQCHWCHVNGEENTTTGVSRCALRGACPAVGYSAHPNASSGDGDDSDLQDDEAHSICPPDVLNMQDATMSVMDFVGAGFIAFFLLIFLCLQLWRCVRPGRRSKRMAFHRGFYDLFLQNIKQSITSLKTKLESGHDNCILDLSCGELHGEKGERKVFDMSPVGQTGINDGCLMVGRKGEELDNPLLAPEIFCHPYLHGRGIINTLKLVAGSENKDPGDVVVVQHKTKEDFEEHVHENKGETLWPGAFQYVFSATQENRNIVFTSKKDDKTMVSTVQRHDDDTVLYHIDDKHKQPPAKQFEVTDITHDADGKQWVHAKVGRGDEDVWRFPNPIMKDADRKKDFDMYYGNGQRKVREITLSAWCGACFPACAWNNNERSNFMRVISSGDSITGHPDDHPEAKVGYALWLEARAFNKKEDKKIGYELLMKARFGADVVPHKVDNVDQQCVVEKVYTRFQDGDESRIVKVKLKPRFLDAWEGSRVSCTRLQKQPGYVYKLEVDGKLAVECKLDVARDDGTTFEPEDLPVVLLVQAVSDSEIVLVDYDSDRTFKFKQEYVELCVGDKLGKERFISLEVDGILVHNVMPNLESGPESWQPVHNQHLEIVGFDAEATQVKAKIVERGDPNIDKQVLFSNPVMSDSLHLCTVTLDEKAVRLYVDGQRKGLYEHPKTGLLDSNFFPRFNWDEQYKFAAASAVELFASSGDEVGHLVYFSEGDSVWKSSFEDKKKTSVRYRCKMYFIEMKAGDVEVLKQSKCAVWQVESSDPANQPWTIKPTYGNSAKPVSFSFTLDQQSKTRVTVGGQSKLSPANANDQYLHVGAVSVYDMSLPPSLVTKMWEHGPRHGAARSGWSRSRPYGNGPRDIARRGLVKVDGGRQPRSQLVKEREVMQEESEVKEPLMDHIISNVEAKINDQINVLEEKKMRHDAELIIEEITQQNASNQQLQKRTCCFCCSFTYLNASAVKTAPVSQQLENREERENREREDRVEQLRDDLKKKEKKLKILLMSMPKSKRQEKEKTKQLQDVLQKVIDKDRMDKMDSSQLKELTKGIEQGSDADNVASLLEDDAADAADILVYYQIKRQRKKLRLEMVNSDDKLGAGDDEDLDGESDDDPGDDAIKSAFHSHNAFLRAYEDNISEQLEERIAKKKKQLDGLEDEDKRKEVQEQIKEHENERIKLEDDRESRKAKHSEKLQGALDKRRKKGKKAQIGEADKVELKKEWGKEIEDLEKFWNEKEDNDARRETVGEDGQAKHQKQLAKKLERRKARKDEHLKKLDERLQKVEGKTDNNPQKEGLDAVQDEMEKHLDDTHANKEKVIKEWLDEHKDDAEGQQLMKERVKLLKLEHEEKKKALSSSIASEKERQLLRLQDRRAKRSSNKTKAGSANAVEDFQEDVSLQAKFEKEDEGKSIQLLSLRNGDVAVVWSANDEAETIKVEWIDAPPPLDASIAGAAEATLSLKLVDASLDGRVDVQGASFSASFKNPSLQASIVDALQLQFEDIERKQEAEEEDDDASHEKLEALMAEIKEEAMSDQIRLDGIKESQREKANDKLKQAKRVKQKQRQEKQKSAEGRAQADQKQKDKELEEEERKREAKMKDVRTKLKRLKEEEQQRMQRERQEQNDAARTRIEEENDEFRAKAYQAEQERLKALEQIETLNQQLIDAKMKAEAEAEKAKTFTFKAEDRDKFKYFEEKKESHMYAGLFDDANMQDVVLYVVDALRLQSGKEGNAQGPIYSISWFEDQGTKIKDEKFPKAVLEEYKTFASENDNCPKKLPLTIVYVNAAGDADEKNEGKRGSHVQVRLHSSVAAFKPNHGGWTFLNPPHDQATSSDNAVEREMQRLEVELEDAQATKKAADERGKKAQDEKLRLERAARKGRKTARGGPDTARGGPDTARDS